MRCSGDRVRIVGVPMFDGRAATVVQDQGERRVYVLIDDAGDNPVPFASAQLKDLA